MILLIIVFCILIGFFAYLKERNLYNPLSLLSGIWGGILVFSTFDLYELYKPSDLVFFIIGLGLLCFFIGILLVMIALNKPHFRDTYQMKRKHINFNYCNLSKIFFAMLIILIISSINPVILLFKGYTLYDIRYVIPNKVFTSNLINILYVYFAKPVLILLIPVSGIKLLKYKDYKLFLILIVGIGLDTIISGGRFIILYTIMVYMIIIMMLKNRLLIPSKVIKIVKYLILLSLILIISITFLRGSSLFKSLYTYSVGPLSLFSIKLCEIDSYTYGFLSLRGFIRPIFEFFEIIDIDNKIPELFYQADEIFKRLGDTVFIGPKQKYNAFVSYFYFFYRDIGLLGVCIGNFLYGIISGISYYRAKKIINDKSLIIYLLITLSLMTSMVRFQFASYEFALSFFYLSFIFRKKKYTLSPK